VFLVDCCTAYHHQKGFYGDCVTGISNIYSDLSCKFPNILSDCNQILILLMDFHKSLTIISHENLFGGRQADTCGWI
jgi:hypothetical protein